MPPVVYSPASSVSPMACCWGAVAHTQGLLVQCFSVCDQSWAYLLSGGCYQFLCGKCCSEWSALYSCWIVLSCCCACLIFSAVKPACTVVKAAWRVSISGPLLHNSVSAFPLVVPFLYTVSKVNSCIARAQ